MKTKKYELDMCHGPLLWKILIFALPLMLSGILQLLFNAADMIVVGHAKGPTSLAAVGATSSLINLLINLFMGLSVGANVLVAHFFAAKQEKDCRETVHTAVLISVISGIFLAFVGVLLSRPLLMLMGTPIDVINKSVLYMRVFFLGMPVMLLYNFGSAILRAVGDTKRPLFYLSVSGVLNILLNLFFVLVFDMDVAGVALATVLSQVLSAFLIVRCLMKTEGYCKLTINDLHIKKDKLLKMIRIGLPAGLQGSIFSISNVLIQSSINSFGSIAMAGNTASSNLEGFVYNAMNAIHQTALTFTSQNFGGKQYKRIKKVIVLNVVIVTLVGCIFGGIFILFGQPLLSLYTSEAAAIEYGLIRMKIIFSTYFLCGIMDVLVGCLRGLGRSILPMIVSLLGACGLRVLWIFTIFRAYPTLESIYISYPISWTLTAFVHLICLLVVMKSLSKKLKEDNSI